MRLICQEEELGKAPKSVACTFSGSSLRSVPSKESTWAIWPASGFELGPSGSPASHLQGQSCDMFNLEVMAAAT